MSSQYGEFINIDQLHYAVVTDTATAYTPGINKYLAPAGEISHEPSVNMKTRYYDGVAMFTTNTEGETKVTITISGVPTKLAAELTGKYYDVSKGVLIDTGEAGNAPWCALSGRMELGDGGYKHFQYLKGKFALGKTGAKTKTDDIDAQTTELTFTAVTTVYHFTVNGQSKGVKGVQGDTTDPAFDPTTWFEQVQTPLTVGATISPIALSSSNPVDGATSVSTTSGIVLTFNNAITSESITVIDSTDGTVKAVTRAWDSTNKVLTLTPSSDLSSSTKYIVSIAGVVDIYGQALAATTIDFTTIA